MEGSTCTRPRPPPPPCIPPLAVAVAVASGDVMRCVAKVPRSSCTPPHPMCVLLQYNPQSVADDDDDYVPPSPPSTGQHLGPRTRRLVTLSTSPPVVRKDGHPPTGLPTLPYPHKFNNATCYEYFYYSVSPAPGSGQTLLQLTEIVGFLDSHGRGAGLVSSAPWMMSAAPSHSSKSSPSHPSPSLFPLQSPSIPPLHTHIPQLC